MDSRHGGLKSVIMNSPKDPEDTLDKEPRPSSVFHNWVSRMNNH